MTDMDFSALLPPPSATNPPETPPRTDMAALKNALAQSLIPYNGEGAEDTLKRQLVTLDRLFEHVLHDYIHYPRSSTSETQIMRLSLLIRLQQSCTTTARTISAVKYMTALTADTKGGAPLPQNYEQTRNGKNDSSFK